MWWLLSATLRLACAASSPPVGSVPSRSACLAATPTGSRSHARSAQPMSSASVGSGDQQVGEFTGRLGAHSILECVGHGEAMRTAVSIARAGGAVGRVGAHQDMTISNAQPTFYDNITIAGGPAPVRAYMEELLPDVLEGRIDPGRVFDRVTNIDGVRNGYRAMNDRESIKVMIEF
jgi:threonine dehydrogenase-like Zn-dependent dehydrogenase